MKCIVDETADGYQTIEHTEEQWYRKYNEPLPLEAYGYPIRYKQVEKQAKKQRQEDYFARIYDKLKEVEFKDKKDLSMEKYFYMPKLDKEFHFGSRNALAIYPVLCGRADFRDDSKWVRISRENIAKLAGIWTGSVDRGVWKLINCYLRVRNDGEIKYSTPLLQRREWQDGKRRGYEYLPGFFRHDIQGLDPRQWGGQYLIFHTCIVDSGVWSELSRKAKALYVAMRSTSFFDQRAYQHIEGEYIPSLDEVYDDPRLLLEDETDKKKFRNRKWEVCDTPLKQLFELGNIPYKDTRELVGELKNKGLVERVLENKSVFKVFLRPKPLLKN